MKDGALTVRTGVRPREIVPVRLMNVSEDSKVLHTGTLIGKLTDIGEVQKPSGLTEVLPSTELRSDLADLLNTITEYISTIQIFNFWLCSP